MIPAGAKDFYVRQKAIQIFRAYGVRPKDRLGEVSALFDWVRRNIRYTRDIFRVELLHSRQADAGIASRRLRRHDDPFGSDADVNGSSSQARAGGLPAQPAARVLTHLSRSTCAGPMDCDRRDSSETNGLGAPALETRM